jgi:allantoicase
MSIELNCEHGARAAAFILSGQYVLLADGGTARARLFTSDYVVLSKTKKAQMELEMTVLGVG